MPTMLLVHPLADKPIVVPRDHVNFVNVTNMVSITINRKTMCLKKSA